MKEEDLENCYDLAEDAVRHVGQIIKNKLWETKTKVETKSCEIDLVTETDREVEEYLISTLRKSYPDHAFIGEESTSGKCNLTHKPTWIIDPIDGTMNFVHGYPNVCVSVALYIDACPEIGMIYNPVLDYFFEARRGGGATMNGKVIHVSETEEISKALLSFEFGTSLDYERKKNITSNITSLIGKVQGVRSSGSAAMNMAMVAMGASDAYFEFGTHAWDVAAGDLIVREAGGLVLDPTGGTFDVLSRRVLCASTCSLANHLAQGLFQIYPTRD